MNETFDHTLIATIGDTNAMGNVYFAKYFSIQGTVRELWVNERVPDAGKVLSTGILMSTKSAHCEYKIPFFTFDTIVCKMHFEDLQRVSVVAVFDFFKEGDDQKYAYGFQKIVFKDENRKTCRMPESFRMAAEEICWQS